MTRRMLIDATHSEEIRVAVMDGNRLDDFDYESAARRTLKGNIYLGKVTRVEPSLQAAFIDYGGNRHGFLPFSDIHPDYYRIPMADRDALLSDDDAPPPTPPHEPADGANGVEETGETAEAAAEDEIDVDRRRTERLRRAYKIQEVIKRRQILLVQVTKEERGNKGAALTTYISLAGRYCVLMPNTTRGGGISRKITNTKDRRRLKELMDQLTLPEGMAIILRTAGVQRTKTEIKRDHDFLMKLWDDIRERTLSSRAPALIYEEANLIKRTIRDIYSREIEEILVEGEEAYRTAKDFMRALMPSHARRVQLYKDRTAHLFSQNQVESQIESLHSSTVRLRSGGSIVINTTEALVAIDVNSGRATRERHIEETALKTNLEAAVEIARQLRLRDLAGLIVIDFIDMEDRRNTTAVERKLKEALRTDRARIQLGRISPLGLFEMSRQRLRPSLFETSMQICPVCHGHGHVRSVESTALHIVRAIEEEAARGRSAEIAVYVPTDVALYILNQKREALHAIEKEQGLRAIIERDDSLILPTHRLEHRKALDRETEAEGEEEEVTEALPAAASEPASPIAKGDETREFPGDEGEEKPRRRRRGRRGGRRRGKRHEDEAAMAAGESPAMDTEEEAAPLSEPTAAPEAPVPEPSAPEPSLVDATSADVVQTTEESREAAEIEQKPKRSRSRRKPAVAKAEAAEAAASEGADADASAVETHAEKPKPTRRRRSRKPAKAAERAVPDAQPADAETTTTPEAPSPTEEVRAEDSSEAFVSDVPAPERPADRIPADEVATDFAATPATPEDGREPAEAEVDLLERAVEEHTPDPVEEERRNEREEELAAVASGAGGDVRETVTEDRSSTEDAERPPEPQPAEANEDRPRRRGWWQRILD